MRLSEFRAKRKLTQSQFARLIGRSQPTVQRWEAGIHVPGRGDAQKIVEITDGQVTPNDFHQVTATHQQAAP